MPDVIYELRDVCKSRLDTRTGQYFEVLRSISVKVTAGALVSIIGPSGAGKSTLLWLLNRLEDPERGQIKYCGRPINEWDVLDLRRRAGLVFQQPVMLPGTVRENLLYGPHLRKGDQDVALEEMINQVGLPPEMLERPAQELSGGEQQRVALARTLANGPEVLLLDEVTSSLDPESTQIIEDLITRRNAQGLTCLWVTHDLEQARRLDRETWVLIDGRMVEDTSTRQIFTGDCLPLTEAFVKGKLREERGNHHD